MSRREMLEVTRSYIRVTLFPGKGGTVGRVGNPEVYEAILAHPQGTISGSSASPNRAPTDPVPPSPVANTATSKQKAQLFAWAASRLADEGSLEAAAMRVNADKAVAESEALRKKETSATATLATPAPAAVAPTAAPSAPAAPVTE